MAEDIMLTTKLKKKMYLPLPHRDIPYKQQTAGSMKTVRQVLTNNNINPRFKT